MDGFDYLFAAFLASALTEEEVSDRLEWVAKRLQQEEAECR